MSILVEELDLEPALVKVLVRKKQGAKLPVCATIGAAGADLSAYLEEPLEVLPGSSCLVPTGIFMEIPHGYEIQIRPRSGLALKHLITVLNSPGTIDCDYRGEIQVILINHGQKSFVVEPGMRIAQAILAKVEAVSFVESADLSETRRGLQGFGSTGTGH